jgi:hypothetical protein
MEKLGSFLTEDANVNGDSEYQKFFNTKLKKYGVTSPTQLSPEKKKEFFAEIEKEWTGEKE